MEEIFLPEQRFNMVFLYQHIVKECSKYRSIDHPGQSLTSLSGDPPQFFYIFRVHEDHLIDKRGIRLACAYHEGTGFPGGIFQGIPKNRIDYIFVSPFIRVLSYKVLTNSYNNGHYPSDHLPITCNIAIPFL